ncbi:GAF and ANTAR domain-containing protein [soil metagenome]
MEGPLLPADPRRDALDSISRFLVTQSTVGETLQSLADIAVQAMPNASLAGISMHDEQGNASTRVFTDTIAVTIDQVQYDTGRGPCLDAWRTGETVHVHDTDADVRYLEFGVACRDHRINSTLSLPIPGVEGTLGALNLYAEPTNGFDDQDAGFGAEMCAALGVVLINSAAYWDAVVLTEQLNEAMQNRATIEQAKGMLMARSRELTADGAFRILSDASQRENVKIRDIAQRILDRNGPETPS